MTSFGASPVTVIVRATRGGQLAVVVVVVVGGCRWLSLVVGGCRLLLSMFKFNKPLVAFFGHT